MSSVAVLRKKLRRHFQTIKKKVKIEMKNSQFIIELAVFADAKVYFFFFGVKTKCFSSLYGCLNF